MAFTFAFLANKDIYCQHYCYWLRFSHFWLSLGEFHHIQTIKSKNIDLTLFISLFWPL
jgi:hypothetical protein